MQYNTTFCFVFYLVCELDGVELDKGGEGTECSTAVLPFPTLTVQSTGVNAKPVGAGST